MALIRRNEFLYKLGNSDSTVAYWTIHGLHLVPANLDEEETKQLADFIRLGPPTNPTYRIITLFDEKPISVSTRSGSISLKSSDIEEVW